MLHQDCVVDTDSPLKTTHLHNQGSGDGGVLPVFERDHVPNDRELGEVELPLRQGLGRTSWLGTLAGHHSCYDLGFRGEGCGGARIYGLESSCARDKVVSALAGLEPLMATTAAMVWVSGLEVVGVEDKGLKSNCA